MKNSKWYYIKENKWFESRKDAKDYLGGTFQFNNALKNKDIFFVILDN